MSQFNFAQLAYAMGHPLCTGRLKVLPEDFKVIEQNDFSLSGEGEHLWLWVEKIGHNTDEVAQFLAKQAKVSIKAIGYAGKKDRQAVTKQWFSIHLPGQATPNVSQWSLKGLKILNTTRHHRKLQIGGLSGNRFELVIKDLSGDLSELQVRCEQVKQQGVPNYFGEQRFGKQMSNLAQAEQLFAGKFKRRLPKFKKGLYLSAARSWVFNHLLSKRVKNHSWHQALEGDVLMLEGSERCFVPDEDESLETLNQRITQADISPTGFLPGLGDFKTQKSVLALEQLVAQQFEGWQQGLEKQGVKQSRRALILWPKDFEYTFKTETGEEDCLSLDASKCLPQLHLAFTLTSGSYATMVVRELVSLV